MNILHEIANKLLKRRELRLQLTQTSTPTHAQALESVATHFKVDAGHVAIKKISNHYGSHHITIEAFVYESADHKKHIEPRVKEKKVNA